MAIFENALQGLDPNIVSDVVHSVGSGMHSPENDMVEKLTRYPAFNSLIACLGERLDDNSDITPEQRRMIMLGAATCMEVLADYAAVETLGDIVGGGYPNFPPNDFPPGIEL